jgi:hypothetical protein
MQNLLSRCRYLTGNGNKNGPALFGAEPFVILLLHYLRCCLATARRGVVCNFIQSLRT